jgi:hypothetical protein
MPVCLLNYKSFAAFSTSSTVSILAGSAYFVTSKAAAAIWL